MINMMKPSRLFLAIVRAPICLGLIIRIAIIIYGEWQDKHFAVQFTDIDYIVLEDGARCILDPLYCSRSFSSSHENSYLHQNTTFYGSPYDRETYRYTPILAYILLLNHVLSVRVFGKLVFVAFDLLTGYLLYKYCLDDGSGNDKVFQSQKWINLFWLWNPLVLTISSRGNAESLVCFFIVAFLYLVRRKKYFWAALAYGFSVHLKIFPILYAWPLYYWFRHSSISSNQREENKSLKENAYKYEDILPLDYIKFGIVSGSVFGLLFLIFYYLYGYKFIYETYLYHLIRKDHRHNFSIYFYPFYLQLSSTCSTYDSIISNLLLSKTFGVLTFVPQALLILIFGKKYAYDLPFACFLLTFIFVTFNKVCTSQYFLWYICCLPIVANGLFMSTIRASLMILLWFIAQAIWLNLAYQLEFLGINTYLSLWLASIGFFSVNIFIISEVIKAKNTNSLMSIKLDK